MEQPLIDVEISRDNLLHNLKTLEKNSHGLAIAPVIKSNAYGHGAVEVGSVLDGEESVPFFVVDSYREARELRVGGIKKTILVLGNVLAENMVNNELDNIHFGITSIEQLRELNEILKKETHIHVKIDTGMRRQGLLLDDIDEAINIFRDNKLFSVMGVCSHLSDADSPDEAFTKRQIDAWNSVAAQWREALPEIEYFHLPNSGGYRFSKEIDANTMRLGMNLYGIEIVDTLGLKPILSMKTFVSQVKKLKKGDKVGYGITYEAPHDMTIAVVPVGYYEGVDRRLSNNGILQIGGTDCSIVGRVSMNITTVDVSHVPNVTRGDAVTVISSNPHAKNSVAHMAERAGTIPYVILVHIPAALHRTVV